MEWIIGLIVAFIAGIIYTKRNAKENDNEKATYIRRRVDAANELRETDTIKYRD